jgi:hypothetical protein
MTNTIDLDNIDPATQMPSSGDYSAPLEPIDTDTANQPVHPGDNQAHFELDGTDPAIRLPSSEDDQVPKLVDTIVTVPLPVPENGQESRMVGIEDMRQVAKVGWPDRAADQPGHRRSGLVGAFQDLRHQQGIQHVLCSSRRDATLATSRSASFDQSRQAQALHYSTTEASEDAACSWTSKVNHNTAYAQEAKGRHFQACAKACSTSQQPRNHHARLEHDEQQRPSKVREAANRTSRISKNL